MNSRFNNLPSVAIRRKELRNDLTDSEKKLWYFLRNSQLGYKFRRQHSIGQFILDFYCPEKKLAIELDGSQHFESDGKSYDAKREEYISSHRITTIRFANTDLRNIDAVVWEIQKALDAPPLAPP